MENQPMPEFTLDDLDDRLSRIYKATMTTIRCLEDSALQANDVILSKQMLKEANGLLQELVAIAAKKKSSYEAISPAQEPTKEQEIIAKAVGQDSKPQFYVAGVQLIEYKRLVGTSLYSTMPKAKTIRDIMNRKFAELKVEHEAKIVQYPVF